MAENEYSIEAPDGKRYGPASLDKLREWVSEGRVVGATVLIAHPGGERVTARDVPGLFEGVAAPPLPKKGMPVWATVLIVLGCVGCCGCGVLSAILFPVFSQARYAAKRTVGLSNMKQLALGAIMYSSDADDRFPTEMGSALAAKPYLYPYVKLDAPFRSVNPKGGEILGDARLSGKSEVEASHPRDTVMFYDSKPWQRDQALASFLDGSAKSLPSGELEKLKARNPFAGAR